jgi:hypothetical protein
MAGKVKVTESLINVVTVDEPKKLIGSGQNGTASVIPTLVLGYTDTRCTADRRDLTQQNVALRNEVNPMLRHLAVAGWPVREADGAAGKGWDKKRMRFRNETDRGSCLTVKAG